MPSPQPQSAWPRVRLIVLVLYWVALFIGTHIPPLGMSGSLRSLRSADKVLHFGAYAGLAVLALSVLAPRTRRIGPYLLVFAVLAAYGALDELLQVPIPSRTGDVWDWVADLAGAACGLTFVWWLRRRREDLL